MDYTHRGQGVDNYQLALPLHSLSGVFYKLFVYYTARGSAAG